MIGITLSKKNKIIDYYKYNNLHKINNILITGASSGIGKSLSCYYSQPGKTLFLWGRSTERLNEAAKLCEEKGAKVYCYQADLTDSNESMNLLSDILNNHQIDMVILAAGSGDIKADHENLENQQTLSSLAHLNYITPCLMANAVATQMIQRKIKGYIVLLGSVAAFHSLPFATGYSSSKAGLTRFADSLRIAVKKWKIHVTLISPGFIDTPMSQRLECDKPFLMTLENATYQIAESIHNHKKEIVLPRLFLLLKWIDLLAPSFLRDFILSHIKVKQGENKQ